MKIILSEEQYNLLFETKNVSAAQTLIDIAVEDYVDTCGKMKAFENIQLALCKGFKNGKVKLEVTNVDKIENYTFEDNVYYVIHLILYVNEKWMLEDSYYEKFETTLAIKIGNILGAFNYYCHIDEVRMNGNLQDNLNESEKKLSKKENAIIKMWNEGYTPEEIKKYTGIDSSEFYTILKDEKQSIDCEQAYQLIQEIIDTTDLINKKINLEDLDYEGGSLELVVDSFNGTLNFIYNDSAFHIEGYATPYWDGNCILPVDISYFEDLDTKEYNDEYDELQMRVDQELFPNKFNSFQEIIDFMNHRYPYLIMPKIDYSIPHYLNRLSN